MQTEIRYKYRFIVRYRNGKTTDVAELMKTHDGEYIFRYLPKNEIEFPGFPIKQGVFKSNVLWESIAFRVTNTLRNQYPGKEIEELLEETSGKLATDHFEIKRILEQSV